MTADSIGGVWTYALDLSRALGDDGIEVLLAVMGRPLTRDQHRTAAAIPTLTVSERPYKLEWMEDPWADVQQARSWLLELERDAAPEIVHLNGYSYASADFRAPVVLVAHSCVLSWWAAVKGEQVPPSWHQYRDRVRAGLQQAAAVVAPTHAMLDALTAHYGTVPNAHVIENACDLSRYSADLKEPFVFSAGRIWDEAKNLELLASIADTLAWSVYVAGDAQRPPGAHESTELPARHTLKSLGQLSRSEMAAWLARASIYAHPARYEPFGLTVLEAAASGCALLLADIPSLRELWDGVALFAPPSDSDAWRRALTTLIDDGPMRERLASAAQERAQRHGLREFAAAYVALYQSGKLL